MKYFIHLFGAIVFGLLILSCSEDSPTEATPNFEGNLALLR